MEMMGFLEYHGIPAFPTKEAILAAKISLPMLMGWGDVSRQGLSLSRARARSRARSRAPCPSLLATASSCPSSSVSLSPSLSLSLCVPAASVVPSLCLCRRVSVCCSSSRAKKSVCSRRSCCRSSAGRLPPVLRTEPDPERTAAHPQARGKNPFARARQPPTRLTKAFCRSRSRHRKRWAIRRSGRAEKMGCRSPGTPTRATTKGSTRLDMTATMDTPPRARRCAAARHTDERVTPIRAFAAPPCPLHLTVSLVVLVLCACGSLRRRGSICSRGRLSRAR